uniref:C-X-C motif chemokine n=1 Tax=Varanus komodoensis TaxID=61221 RepID=A0A8D2J8B8_VARKO
ESIPEERSGGMSGERLGKLCAPPCQLLNLTSGPSAAAPWSEKPCLCIQTLSWMVPPRQISKVTIYPEGPQCSVPEVIATLKSGREICLDPTAAWLPVKPGIMDKCLPPKSFLS